LILFGLNANTFGLALTAMAFGAFAVYWYARRRPGLGVVASMAAFGIVALLVALVLFVGSDFFQIGD
jgi:membrane protease YdiL (CAAX protease family)